MATMFEQLMTGLDEVEAYLAGAREDYKVHVRAASDESAAATAADANTKCEMSSLDSE